MPTVRHVSPTPERKKESQQPNKPVMGRRQAQQEAMKRAAKAQRHNQHSGFDDENKSTPILLKILSWLGIILLCFVLGYLGASWLVELLNKKLLLKPENRIENQEDLSQFQESEQTKEILNLNENVNQLTLNLYHVKNDTIAETRQVFMMRAPEDNINDAVSAVISLSGIKNAEKIKLLHVFRNSETVFLDMSGQFASALESAGQRQSLLLLTGIVRTLQENFPPISQVRFLIDSKPPKSGGVVDLSTLWKMPKKS